jgi:hypothetical protein
MKPEFPAAVGDCASDPSHPADSDEVDLDAAIPSGAADREHVLTCGKRDRVCDVSGERVPAIGALAGVGNLKLRPV